jgi:hypothetical protein
MKILKKIWGISLLAILLAAAPRVTFAQDDEAITEQDFYDALSPYGTWVYDNTYGDVWLPDVDEDFRPYQTAGYWLMTEYGNTWVSDYAWGWATFHYGSWRFDDYYGWEWIPGYEWAPAWVSWRSGDGYYGWAPLSPDVDFSMSIGGGNYANYWAFAPAAYIYNQSIYDYYIPRTKVRNIIRRTTVVNNVFVRNGRRYAGGPRATDIERYTHRKPKVYTVTNASRPGIAVGARSVSIFRPNISRSPNARPQRVVDAKAYQQQNPNQRIARGGGSLTFSRSNAQRLAMEARSSNTKVMRVNGQSAARPDQQPVQAPQRRPSAGTVNPLQQGNAVQLQRGSANSTSQQNRANQSQQNNTNAITTPPYRGRRENRPNVTPPRMQDRINTPQQRQQREAQQPAIQQTQPRGQAHQDLQQADQQQRAVQQAGQQHRAQFEQQKQQAAQHLAEQQRQAQQQAAQQQAAQRQAEQQRQAQQKQQAAQRQAEQQQQAQQQAAQRQAQQQQQQQQHRRPPERRPQ